MADKSYKADSITVLKGLEAVRKNYELAWLLEESKRYKTITQFSQKIGIRNDVLGRALAEAKITKLFPSLNKSKAGALNHFKVLEELELFSKICNIHKNSCRTLRKEITAWNSLISKNPNILLTSLQHDLVVGSLFGDSNARKRWNLTYFRCGHSEKQKSYLKWKYETLRNFITCEIYVAQRKNRLPMYEFQTLSHSVFNRYYELFYKKGKKVITREALNLLNPRSLAFWICDDGSYDRQQGYIILCTNSFSLEEHYIMRSYFKEKWNINPTIGKRDNKYYYLRFKQEDSKKLIRIIKNFIPIKEMLYKVGEEL